jgi:phage terminase large subunit
MTKDELLRLAWATGRLEWLLLDSNQKTIRSFINSVPEDKGYAVVICSRQIGKTRTLLTDAVSYAIQNPNSIIVYVTATGKAAKRIVKVGTRPILASCPKDLKPSFNSQDLEYTFPNGSLLIISGLDNESDDRIRGIPIHRWYIDEARNIRDLQYAITNILQPATLTTKGIGVLASTPPNKTSHELVSYISQARADNTLIQKTIYDCPRFSEADINLIKNRTINKPGGKVAWRREYLCELVRDEERAVCPEFDPAKHIQNIPEEEPTSSYDHYFSYDQGFLKDNAGLLLGYWDFSKQTLIITKEKLLKRKNTDETAEEMKQMLAGFPTPYLMVGDAPPQLLADYSTRHKLHFFFPKKAKLTEQIATLRAWLHSDQILISPECTKLIQQLEEAVWSSKDREEIERSEALGHADLLMALCYMVRSVVVNRNPNPKARQDPSRMRMRDIGPSQEAQDWQRAIFGNRG